MQFVFWMLAVGMGVCFAVYLPILSQSGQIVNSPVLANIPFFFFGLVTSFVLALVLGHNVTDLGRLREVPPWMYVSGILSGLMVLGISFLIPRVGAGAFFVLVVAGQIFTGVALSHFGLVGNPVDPVSIKKIAGLLLVTGGAYLVALG